MTSRPPPTAEAPDERAAAAPALGRRPVLRACLMYVSVFSASGLNQPYMPVWLASRGLSDPQIAVVIAAPMFLRLLVTPAFGMLADRAGNYRIFINVMAAAVLCTAVVLFQAHSYPAILVLYAFAIMLWSAINPVVDAGTIRLVRRGIARDYGRLRLWGSASFAAATAIGGFILGAGGPDGVFLAFIAANAFVLAMSFAMPVVPPVKTGKKRTDLHLHRRPLLLLVFLCTALVLASQTMFNVFGTVHMRELGFPPWAIGLLWTLATSSEIAMFWAGPILIRYLGPFGFLAIAAGGAVVRWSLMSLDPGIPLTAALQVLHAATFSGSYLGLMRFVQTTVEDEVGARVQSAFVTLLGFVTALATLATGPLYRSLGAGAYEAAAVLPAVALVLLFVARGRLRAAVEEGASVHATP